MRLLACPLAKKRRGAKAAPAQDSSAGTPARADTLAELRFRARTGDPVLTARHRPGKD